MPIKDTDRKARANYEKKCRQVKLVLYPTDQDIADYIDSTDEPTATLIKRLIREEIAKKQVYFADASGDDAELCEAAGLERSYRLYADSRDSAVSAFGRLVEAAGLFFTGAESNGLEVGVKTLDGQELIFLLDQE